MCDSCGQSGCDGWTCNGWEPCRDGASGICWYPPEEDEEEE